MNPYISLVNLKTMPVVDLSATVQKAIENVFLLASSRISASERALDAASDSLLDALGLVDWTPPEPLSYTASARDAALSRRLDARFFAPRIQALLDILSVDGQTIRDVATPRREKFRSNECLSFNYIEISDLDGSGATGSTGLACSEAPSRATWHVRPDDIITSSVRPIRRSSAQIAPDQDGFVCSSGFVVIEPTDITPEVLLTYLRLPVICELLDLYASASMYPAITENDVFDLPLPQLSEGIADQVTRHVRDARKAKASAGKLLDAAKHAVEIAIEDGEPSALAYLDTVEGEN